MNDGTTLRSTAGKVAALMVVLACLVTGAACWLRTPGSGPPADTGSVVPGSRGIFTGWPKPDFVFVLSAQQHGYLMPCGCSKPQYGGLERRYNFVQGLRDERGWKVIALDLGDIPQDKGPASLPNLQGLIKYRYSMEALKKIGYTAVSFGQYEAAQPLSDAVDEYALNNRTPAVLAANLTNKTELFPDPERRSKSYIGSWETVQPVDGVKVGVLGMIGSHDQAKPTDPKSVAALVAEKDAKFKFGRIDRELPGALKEMAGAVADFRVLLYQGPVEKAKVLAGLVPDFQLILCLSVEDEPPGRPELANGGKTFIVRVGHKGKNLGVVGVNRTGKAANPFELRYQLVTLDEDYLTPEGKRAAQPIAALLERYTKDLRDENYLARYGQNTHAVQFGAANLPKYKDQLMEYVGSEKCEKCHKDAYDIWKQTPHAHAYKTLVDAPPPAPDLVEYDPECIVCHTVGFAFKSGFTDAKKTAHLKNVGCESCHGPSSLHVKNPNDVALHQLINPHKAPPNEQPAQKEKRMLAIEQSCQKCHDQDNDVHWTFDKWSKPTPKSKVPPIHMTVVE